MALDLGALVRPDRTALVTLECQEGVLGAASRLPALARQASESGVVDTIGSLVRTARSCGVQIVHCVVERRPDGRGSNANARLFAVGRRGEGGAARAEPAGAKAAGAGAKPAAVVAGIGVEPEDIVMSRIHGLSALAGTGLDPVLRNLGTKTVVAVGVSVNIAVTSFAFDAVNLGYQVVLPRDAVVGIPAEYAGAVLENTLSLVATITTAGSLAGAWSTGA